MSPERSAICDAIPGDMSGWWEHSFAQNPARLHIEARPGGRFNEIFDESGDGVVHGTVIYAKRGECLRFAGPLGFSGQPVQIVTTYDFAAAGADSTRLVVEIQAAGTLEARERTDLEGVWRHFILRRFKPYVEARHGFGAAPGPAVGDVWSGELDAIARLHARGMAAARAGDAEALSGLWNLDAAP